MTSNFKKLCAREITRFDYEIRDHKRMIKYLDIIHQRREEYFKVKMAEEMHLREKMEKYRSAYEAEFCQEIFWRTSVINSAQTQIRRINIILSA